jgi:hypothetical protein
LRSAASDRLSGIDRRILVIGASQRKCCFDSGGEEEQNRRMSASRLALLVLWFGAAWGCSGTAVTLHAPRCARSVARTDAARVDVEPIASRKDASADSTVDLGHPGPAAVLTSALKEELDARALTGGEPEGYRVRCTLDRFALRMRMGIVGSAAIATMYVDLGCAVEKRAGDVLLWRGALRGRSMATGATPLSSETALAQSLADRAMSDASRELASDLAVRVLGLGGAPSARVFADEAARAASGGVDDTLYGSVALSEASDRVGLVLPSLRDVDPAVRAAAWNAVAMAAGPGERWFAGDATPDDEPTVRFYQYKALARSGSLLGLSKLKDARRHEEEAWLLEMLDDALATGGLGLPRR